MKFITDLSSYTVAATTGSITSEYGVSNVKDDYPSHPFISSDSSETISLTYSAGVDSLFLGHVCAESVDLTFNTGETVSYTNRIDWNSAYYKGRKKLADDLFIDVPTSSTSVSIDLENTTDLKSDIYQFSSNGTTGFLSDGTSAILFVDYPQLRVGTTLVHSGGSDQIKELLGTGAGSGDVVLIGGTTSFVITSLLLPVSVGVIRLGNKTSFPNPSVGFSQGAQDFGIRRESFGTMLYSARDIVKTFQVPVQLSRTQLDTFKETFDGLRGQPVPTDLLENVDSRLVGFMTMAGIPEVVANFKSYSIFDVSFEIREVG